MISSAVASSRVLASASPVVRAPLPRARRATVVPHARRTSGPLPAAALDTRAPARAPTVTPRAPLPRARHLRHSVAARAADAAAEPPAAEPEPKQVTTFVVGILWFFAHQAIGVGNDVIMKYTGSTLGVAQVVFLRFAFATLTMLPVMFASGVDSFKTDRIPLHVARSVLLAAGIALYCKGLAIAPIAVVTTLNFTIPLFTLVMARIFLKETVDATRWIGTLVGFAGVMVVVQPGGAAFNPMLLVVLLSAAMFASLDVLNKVFVGKESFWAMIFYTAFFTTLIAAVPAWMAWVPPSAMQLGLLAVLGAGANLLLYCLLKSFSMVDASALAPFRYTELMWSAAVGWAFFAEIPAASTLIGAAVIIPSTLYVVWAENQKSKESSE
jgi:S-adenosylmethionine uptake transporter